MNRPLLLGPIPPPTDGRAVATAWLLDALDNRGVTFEVVDTQLPAGRLRPARKAVRCLRATLMLIASGGRSLLLVASAGAGLWLELPALLAARASGGKIYMVHHSSMYVRRTWLPMVIAVRLGGRHLHHVFLSMGMQADFCRRYGVVEDGSIILDNALLVPDYHDVSTTRERSLVHISALSRAKGLVTSVQIAERLGVPLRLGGPVSHELTRLLRSAAGRADVTYVGFVDHNAKRSELSRSRVFPFPSTYSNEAQPLVIYEAASAGTIPIAWDIGWIREQMDQLGLSRFVIPEGDEDELLHAAEYLLSLSDDDFDCLSQATMKRFRRLRSCRTSALDELAHVFNR